MSVNCVFTCKLSEICVFPHRNIGDTKGKQGEHRNIGDYDYEWTSYHSGDTKAMQAEHRKRHKNIGDIKGTHGELRERLCLRLCVKCVYCDLSECVFIAIHVQDMCVYCDLCLRTVMQEMTPVACRHL